MPAAVTTSCASCALVAPHPLQEMSSGVLSNYRLLGVAPRDPVIGLCRSVGPDTVRAVITRQPGRSPRPPPKSRGHSQCNPGLLYPSPGTFFSPSCPGHPECSSNTNRACQRGRQDKSCSCQCLLSAPEPPAAGSRIVRFIHLRIKAACPICPVPSLMHCTRKCAKSHLVAGSHLRCFQPWPLK